MMRFPTLRQNINLYETLETANFPKKNHKNVEFKYKQKILTFLELQDTSFGFEFLV